MDIYITLGIIAILMALWYQKRRYHMSLFRRLNIPGPEPHLLTGNLKEYNEKGPAECQLQWTQKYGKILGYYLGSRPMLLVSDTDLLKSVLVKDFQDFVDRDIFLSDGGVPDPRAAQTVSVLPGNRWKVIRSLLSPAFTTNKMKQMTYAVINSSEILANIIKEKVKNNEEIDVMKLFRSLAMDIIGRTAFGIRTDVQHDSKDMFLQNIRRITEDAVSDTVILWTLCLPELDALFMFYRRTIDILRGIFGLSSAWRLFRDFKKVIKKRRIEKTVRPDLLQIMIEANISAEELKEMTGKQLTANMDNDDDMKQNRTSSSKLRYMTNDEVMANAMVFMLAGYDTTASTLSFVLHLLTNYPDVQEKVRQEINDVLEKEELDYPAITKMRYLEQVIAEALRLYPTVLSFTMRTVGKSFTYKNFQLPKGLVIQPALWKMHRDPDLWENAEEFNPDRFSPERKASINQYAYQPFGVGPRNCIGLRFAYTVMKLSLAKLLHSFRFVMSEKTEKGDPKLEFRLFQINPINGVTIRAVPV